jgi:hypothetical protein
VTVIVGIIGDKHIGIFDAVHRHIGKPEQQLIDDLNLSWEVSLRHDT